MLPDCLYFSLFSPSQASWFWKNKDSCENSTGANISWKKLPQPLSTYLLLGSFHSNSDFCAPCCCNHCTSPLPCKWFSAQSVHTDHTPSASSQRFCTALSAGLRQAPTAYSANSALPEHGEEVSLNALWWLCQSSLGTENLRPKNFIYIQNSQENHWLHELSALPRVRNCLILKIKVFQVWGQDLGDESLAEKGMSLSGCCSVNSCSVNRKCRNMSRLPCNVQEFKQIAAKPRQPQYDSQKT